MDVHVKALFEEHSKPAHCGKRQIHDQLAPLGETIVAMHQQIAIYRTHLVRAELAPHDYGLDGKFEMLHQTLNSLELEAGQVFAGLRRLATSATQWDRYMMDAERDIAAFLARSVARGADDASGEAEGRAVS